MAKYVTSGVLAGDMIKLELSRIYGWTYHEIETQPTWYVDLAIEKLRIDNEKAANATIQTT